MSEELTLKTGHEGSTGDQLRAYWLRVKSGEMGALPAIGAAVILLGLFGAMQRIFLTPLNITNLFAQSAELIVMTTALVFVILLAEIDLSAGVTAGTGMAIFVKLNQLSGQSDSMFHGWPWLLNLLIAFVIGFAVGWFLGFFVAKIGVPSFVISLALYLALPGVMLLVLGEGGVLRIEVPEIKAIAMSTMPIWAGWATLGLSLLVTAGMALWDRARRLKANLPVKPLALLGIKLAAIAVLGGGIVQIMSVNRRVGGIGSQAMAPIEGVPISLPIVLVILFACTFVLDRTRFGRHLYAVGGNPEAARRAGIKVAKIRISAFVICSLLAMIAGILHVSKVGNVESAAGRSIVLQAVAAAVVGGVSLFGGRGRLASAALGAFVIQMIENGLALIGIGAGFNFIITGAVLLTAATIDALARKRSGGSLTRA